MGASSPRQRIGLPVRRRRPKTGGWPWKRSAGRISSSGKPYATFGSRELAKLVADGLEGRTAVLMKNHGLIVAGRSLRRAGVGR